MSRSEEQNPPQIPPSPVRTKGKMPVSAASDSKTLNVDDVALARPFGPLYVLVLLLDSMTSTNNNPICDLSTA